MVRGRFGKFLGIVLVVLLSGIVTAGVVLADTLIADGDGVVPVASNAVTFGVVTPGEAASRTVLLQIERGPGTGGGVTFRNGSDASFVLHTPPSYLSMSAGTITLPSDWQGQSVGSRSTVAIATLTITVPVGTAAGDHTGTVQIRANGINANNNPFNRNTNLSYSYTIESSQPPQKTTPTVTTWPTATAIMFGQTLADSTINDDGVTSVPGTFTFDDPATAPNAGTADFPATFTPDDTANFYTVSGTIGVTVNKATPTVTTWPTATAITFGQTLADSTINDDGVTSVPGTFTFDDPATAPNAGTADFPATFTPDDTANFYTVSGTISVHVTYIFGGIQQPINTNGSSIFRLGSTVPVKFRLFDHDGDFVTTATARIFVSRMNGAVTGTEVEAVSTSAATTGNLFRLSDDQYIFNWGTRGLQTGTWQIRIELNDGTSRSVLVSLR